MRKLFITIGISTSMMWGMQTNAAVFSDDVVFNGNFSAGLAGWTGNVSSYNLTDQYALDGTFLTMGQYNQTVHAEQTVTAPAESGRARVKFYYRFFTTDTTKSDYFSAKLINTETGKTVAERVIYAKNGQMAIWKKLELEGTGVSDAKIKLVFSVTNNNTALTFVDVDKASVTVDSFAELSGTVVDAEGNAVRNAKVVVRTAKGDKVWEGTSNKQGKFLADHLKPRDQAYTIRISKDERSVEQTVTVKWAKQAKHTYTLE